MLLTEQMHIMIEICNSRTISLSNRKGLLNKSKHMLFIRMLAIALLLIPLNISVKAQNYKPLISSDLVWYEEYINSMLFSGPFLDIHHWVKWGADTIIGGATYTAAIDTSSSMNDLSVFCRMENDNSRAYKYNNSGRDTSVAEFLIYDLNLEPSDSIIISVYEIEAPPPLHKWTETLVCHVDGKDSIFFQDEYLTRLYVHLENIMDGQDFTAPVVVSDGKTIIWIEGVGVSTGICSDLNAFSGGETGHNTMRCAYLNNVKVFQYELKGTEFYSFPDCCNQDTLLVTQIAGKMVERCTIYPNPTKNNVAINLPGESNWVIQLRDLSGKLVLEELFNGYSYQLQLPTLANGVYLLHIKNNKTEYVNKLVIQ